MMPDQIESRELADRHICRAARSVATARRAGRGGSLGRLSAGTGRCYGAGA